MSSSALLLDPRLPQEASSETPGGSVAVLGLTELTFYFSSAVTPAASRFSGWGGERGGPSRGDHGRLFHSRRDLKQGGLDEAGENRLNLSTRDHFENDRAVKLVAMNEDRSWEEHVWGIY